jgi:hypothetical protein
MSVSIRREILMLIWRISATVLMVISMALSVSAEEPKKTKSQATPPTIRVHGKNWGGAGRADLRKVYASAAEPLWIAAGKPALKPIDVSRSTASPITLFKRGPNKEYLVRINVNGSYWAQAAYQFAHELGHILCNYRNERTANKWFEETICELASLYALRQMAETWKTRPPYPHWKSYNKSLAKYAQDRIDKHPLPKGTTLSQYVAENLTKLQRNQGLRTLNTIVAVQLLPLLEAEPDRWTTVAYLNSGDPNSAPTFDKYMVRWHASVPKKDKAWVKKVAGMLGFQIPDSKKP